MKFFFLFLSIFLVIYVLLVGILYSLQERFIFFPTHLDSNFNFPYFKNIEEVFLEASPQANIHSLHFKVEQPKGIILYFHGNTRSLDDWGFAAEEFTKHDWEVFMPDYRTYGKSTGELTEEALFDDALMCYQYLQKQYAEEDIIIYGRSLGTGIATQLGTQTKPKRIILETPYHSMNAMVKKVLPIIPPALLKYKFKSNQYIKRISCPIEIFHGTKDTLIPLKQAQHLAVLGKPNTNLTIIEGGAHNDLSDFEVWQNRIQQLLE